MNNKLLYLDTSYNYKELEKKNLLNTIKSRDLNGYFKKVWVVNPVASLSDKDFYNLDSSRIKIKNISKNHIFIESASDGFKILKFFPKINFIFSQLELFFYLFKLIKLEKISIIKSGDVLYAGLLGLIVAKISKLPFVVRVASNNDKIREVIKMPMQKKLFLNIKFENFAEKFILKRIDAVLAANFNNSKFAIDNGADKNKIYIIRYGNWIHNDHYLDPNLRSFPFEEFNSLNVKANSFILYIGRLEKEKHPEDVIHIANNIVKNFDRNIMTLLVGDGSMKKDLIKLIEKLNLKNNVILCGEKDQNWIAKMIPHSRLIISPHTCRALCEVSLGNSTVIGYDIDWQSELIDHGINGYLAPYRDLNKLTEYAISLFNDAHKSKKFAGLLRKKALLILDRDNIIKNEINVYTRLIKKK